MSKITDAIDALVAKYETQRTVDESAKTLLSTLAQLIRDNANAPAALMALADKIESDKVSMADAIVANTPAEEPPVDPVDPGPTPGRK